MHCGKTFCEAERPQQFLLARPINHRAKEFLKYDVLHEGCAESTAKSSARCREKAAAPRILNGN
jgi:hypothetical protein